tara:strand:- start:232 stop:504 length:273 start_codon:yes stop_codon:yes gene_type:complete
MSFHPERVESSEAARQFEFKTQLEADLATGIRGGNKARLIARCFVAYCDRYIHPCSDDEYQKFRALWMKRTFAKIHEEFDHVLPVKYRAK